MTPSRVSMTSLWWEFLGKTMHLLGRHDPWCRGVVPPCRYWRRYFPTPNPCRHQWEHRSSFGDPYRKCLNCGAVEDR